MQSRTRKIMRCENDYQTIQKQLSNDFQVNQFLKDNKLTSINIESYAKLLNSLIQNQQQRKSHLIRLQVEQTEQRDKKIYQERMKGDSTFASIFEEIQEKTCQEMEISSNLSREIVQTKKSLNLLKGDIGHLVSRNQSAKLLSSKITKVKIVADDQLKRVTLALGKDKEEIKMRNQMQKKFSKKLKNVSAYQSTSLGKLKKNHANLVFTKQEIYDKLASTQKMTQNMAETMMLQGLKQNKDQQNLQQMQAMVNLAQVVRHFSLSNLGNLPQDVNNLMQCIDSYWRQLPQMSKQFFDENQSIIRELTEEIIGEYQKIKESIKAQTRFYNELLQVKEELKQKIWELQKEETQLFGKFQIQAFESYRISEEAKRSYHDKIKRFSQILKTYFAILAYLQKNYSFDNSNQRQTAKTSVEKGDWIQQRDSEEKQPPYYSYITQLHKIHQILMHEQDGWEIDQLYYRNEYEVTSFFQSMTMDIQTWLQEIQKKLKVQYFNEVMGRRQSKVHRKSMLYSSYRNSHCKKESASLGQDQDALKQVQKEEQQFLRNSLNKSDQNSCKPIGSRVKNLSKNKQTEVKAKRIKFLEDIDSDYYKMIKSTIKMEKQNTRKNYQFQRTFKRTKYSSRDNILQEKRFQASFSVLYTKQSASNLHKTNSKLQSMHSGFADSRSFKTTKGFTNSNGTASRATFKKYLKKQHSGIQTPKHQSGLVRKSSLQTDSIKLRLTGKLKQALNYSQFKF